MRSRRLDEDQAAVRVSAGHCTLAWVGIARRRAGTAAGRDQVGSACNSRAAGMGGLRRSAHVDCAEHGAVLAAGHDLRWRRPDDVRLAGHAGARVAPHRTGSGTVEPRARRSRWTGNAYADACRNAIARARHLVAHAFHPRAERGREGQQRRRDDREPAGQRAGGRRGRRAETATARARATRTTARRPTSTTGPRERVARGRERDDRAWDHRRRIGDNDGDWRRRGAREHAAVSRVEVHHRPRGIFPSRQ